MLLLLLLLLMLLLLLLLLLRLRRPLNEMECIQCSLERGVKRKSSAHVSSGSGHSSISRTQAPTLPFFRSRFQFSIIFYSFSASSSSCHLRRLYSGETAITPFNWMKLNEIEWNWILSRVLFLTAICSNTNKRPSWEKGEIIPDGCGGGKTMRKKLRPGTVPFRSRCPANIKHLRPERDSNSVRTSCYTSTTSRILSINCYLHN